MSVKVESGKNLFRGGKKIIIGGELLEQVFLNTRKAFIVCDPFIENNKQIKYLTDILDKRNISYEIYSHIKPDPDIELVTDGIASLAEADPDTIVGFGGGSAIDACKAMMFFAERQKLISHCLFVAIPTTSGTGSEVTDFSVITHREQGIKYPLVNEALLPDVAVLDAALTVTVPKEITAITGMDVLTHAIEAMVSKNSTDFSDAMAEKAIKLIRSHLMTAYENPSNIEARQAMHNASCLAGLAFNNAGLGLNHSMAHALGAQFHIPHGKANAVLLPYVMGFNAGCFDNLTEYAKDYGRIARLIKVDSESLRQSGLNLIRAVKKFNVKLGMPSDIRSMGISKEEFKAQLDKMAKNAAEDRCSLTNPRDADTDDIKRIYVHAYFGNVGRRL